MQEATAREVLAQALYFDFAELHLAVSRDVQERKVKERRIGEGDLRFRALDGQRGPLGDLANEIRQAGRIGIPITTAFVLHASDRQTTGAAGRRHRRERQRYAGDGGEQDNAEGTTGRKPHQVS